jgi:hypothetical protein
MSFDQVTFLGATVRQFNCNLGWNKEVTSINISLVEDESNGDSFSNPGIFSLAYFRFYEFDYYGIVTNIEESKGQDGNPLLNVVLSDPRQFLSGVHLILDGYNGGVFNVPNLYNIYGYLENIEFGYSKRVSGGIPYSKVREGLLALINTVPINYRGIDYQVDLSGLPNIPDNYLINSNDMTFMDFIDEVCEVANYDYIVELIGNIIHFVSVNRNQPYSVGSIKRYVDRKEGYSSSSVSLQGEYNTINKFIVGPQREDIYFQHFNNDQDPESFIDNYISNFWGLDRFGNVILPNSGDEYLLEYGDVYSVTVEGFSITDQTYLQNPVTGILNGPTHDTISRNFINGYTFDIGELRAALASREAWESYIIFNDYIVPQDSTIKRSVHENKTKKLELTGEVPDKNTFSLIFNNRPMVAFNPAEISRLKNAAAVTPFNEKEAYIQRVYDFVRNYAENYYGVKVMVRTPFVSAKYNEYGDIETSYEPSESGYIDESAYLNAVRRNLMPFYTDLVTNQDRKIEPYIKLDASTKAFLADGTFIPDHTGLDISNIPSDQYYIGNTRVVEDNDGNPDTNIHISSLFIKATIDPKLVFLNKATAFGPRVVINLPGKIYINGGDSGPEFTLRQIFRKKGLNNNLINSEVEKFKAKVGQDSLILGGAPRATLPLLAVFPLRNNLLTYGPWYTQNGQGKVEFSKDETMAPWNFGGFNNLDQAANILVSNMSEARFFGEGGTIEFAGVPDIKLGRQILADGPIISNMSCSIDSGGIVTRYTLGRWDQKSGRNNKYIVDQFKKTNDVKKEVDKVRRELNKPEAPLNNNSNLRLAKNEFFPRRRVSNSSSQLILSDISVNPDYEFISGVETPISGYEKFYQSNTALMPFYTAIDHLRDENWQNKGGATLDSLFRPYSTNSSSEGISHFEEPLGNNVVDSNKLNPFKDGHDIQAIFYGDTVPSGLSRESFTDGEDRDYRPVALKGPMVLTGWGFDTENKPVPSVKDDPNNSGVVPSGSSDSDFMEGYLHRSDQWKTGPIDLRWDRERKVWANRDNGGYVVLTGDLISGLTGSNTASSGFCTVYNIENGDLVGAGKTGYLYNVFSSDIYPGYHTSYKIKEGEYVYTDGGRQLQYVLTGQVRVNDNSLEMEKKAVWVYPYSGETIWETILEGSGC